MAWAKLTTKTLTGSSDTITTDVVTPSIFVQGLSHTLGTGATSEEIRVGNTTIDTGTNYAYRNQYNGNPDGTSTNATYLHLMNNTGNDSFSVYYMFNKSSEEKLFIGWINNGNNVGAGNVPERQELAGKWVNTSNQANIFEMTDINAGVSYTTDSNLSALGSDGTPANAVPFPSNVPAGSRFEETDTRKIYFASDPAVYRTQWNLEGTISTLIPTRGVFGGGYSVSASNVMDYITIATTGNATDFGDLTVARNHLAGVNSDTRGVFGGGDGSSQNEIDYITIATTGNATDFGDLTVARALLGGLNSDTRGVFGGGGVYFDVMDYITIATTGNATDFGDLVLARHSPAGVNSDTRGVFGGGYSGGASNIMEYITIATTSNTTDFGDLTVARYFLGGLNSDTRGVFGGGGGDSNVMDYITIATTGNATDFGDLTVSRTMPNGLNSNTRGIFGGGYVSEVSSNVMDYITIATTSNATDFGDLTVGRVGTAGVEGV